MREVKASELIESIKTGFSAEGQGSESKVEFHDPQEGKNALDALCLGIERYMKKYQFVIPEEFTSWDEYFVFLAKFIARKSKDKSTKAGTVIVGPDNEIRTTGYNGLPRGVSYKPERTDVRPEKYFWFEHAERNAVCNAARMGMSLKGCTVYTTGPACADCARALIQSGVSEVVMPEDISDAAVKNKSQWGDSCDRAQQMFEESGVKVRHVEGL